MSFGAKITDTIVAIAASGSIGIIRLSGRNAYEIATNITRANKFNPRYANLHNIYVNNVLVDNAIVIYFKAPKSFTGEDIIEIQCHGGRLLSEMILQECTKYGARLARSGEFSYRAVLNGKMTIDKAESASQLANAQSKKSIELLAQNLTGKLGEFVIEIRNNIYEILAYSETAIDYSGEDLPDDLKVAMLKKFHNLIKKTSNTLNSSLLRQGLFDGFRIAIIGKPNVGKSSLLNNLLNFDRAIVSDNAGTTRDTIEEWINIGDYRAKIIDTAGIRNSIDEIESRGIELSIKAFNSANIIIAVFDGSNELSNDDNKILDLINNAKDKLIVLAISKMDLPQTINLKSFDNFNIVNIGKNHHNFELIDTLKNQLSSLDSIEDVAIVGKRQIDALQKTLQEIEFAQNNINELELLSLHLNDAINAISEITTPPEYDELLDKIFSTFCLGK